MTFSRPVLDPVIQFGGLGGNNTGPGNRSATFHGTLTLTTPGLTLTKVGTGTNYQVTGGSKITAVDDRTSTSCTTVGTPASALAACGSARINGLVTSATFAMGAVTAVTARPPRTSRVPATSSSSWPRLTPTSAMAPRPTRPGTQPATLSEA